MPDGNDQNIIEPVLVETTQTFAKDRRILIWVLILPYVFFAAMVLVMVLFSSMAEERVTLAAATILAPLGTLAGGIVAYYFKTN